MIALVEQETAKQHLLRLCEKTPYGCKIASVIRAYGFDRGFACFWLDPAADTVFCHADDVMLLSGTVVQPEETAAFLQAIGPKAVLCALKNAEALGLTASETGDVLKKQLEPGEPQLTDDKEPNIRQIFTLLNKSGMVEEFEPFYLDLSHRVRHNAAMVFTEYREEELAGCAVVSSISENAVILSALAVEGPYRRQGIGTALVRRVEKSFPGKTVYVFREKEKNREFYRENGYVKTETWVYSER